jgi:sulfur transfer protein SufE
MKFYLALSLLLAAAPTNAFVVGNQPAGRLVTQLASVSKDSKVDLGLTPELQRVTDAFSAIADEQTRYKQLLYMAQHTEKANNMPDSSKTPANKVPGCLSTVFIDGKATFDEEKGDYVIDFIGDSDGLLTKGLVALLVR